MKGRILCIDYGDTRIGLAISDEMMLTAYPYKTLTNSPTVLTQLSEIITQEKISLIVIGMPVHYDGNSSPQTEKVKKFIKKLKQTVSIEIDTYNELYTSNEAQQILLSQGLCLRKNKEKIDQIAASIILKNYLESREK